MQIVTKYAAILAVFLVAMGGARSLPAAITVSFDLAVDKANNTTPVPTNIQDEIRNAINAAVAVYNEWSNYSKNLYVVYNSGVATADANFNGTIRFGPGAQYRTPMTAFHEINHTMGAGTYGTWQSKVDNNAKLWLGPAGIAMSEQYFPDNTLKADYHIHWVGSGPTQNVDMFREGVHIVGALRQDMGLSNGNLYDVLGDFSNNGTIGLEDYSILVANTHKDVSAFSASQKFLRGDFNADGTINFADLIGFTSAYNAEHGRGALELALSVPEPAALAILASAMVALLKRRCTRMGKTFVAGLALLAISGADEAHAQWRYYDASLTAGNSNTGPSSAFKPGSNGQADDNLWSLRTGFSSSSTFFQSGDGNDGENSPEIWTTISGLTPNSFYAVNAHFWDAGPVWSIRAGFVPGNLTLFANPSEAAGIGGQNAVLASSLSYAIAPTVTVESDRTMYAGLVGTTKSNAAGEIKVYLDDLPSTNGVNQRTWYDGLSYQPTTLQTLSLRVNTETGGVSLRNETAASVNIRYYEVRSASGAFNPIRWTSFDDGEEGDVLGIGWDELGGSSATILSEFNFRGSTTFAPNDWTALGKVFQVGGLNDIVFSYGLAGQTSLTSGFVDYVSTPGLPGDFNGDDAVDGADLAQWQADYGANGFSDADVDGDSDGADFLIWQRNVTVTSPPAATSSVPEPTTLVALFCALLIPMRLRC
jgi:hypothetical protein